MDIARRELKPLLSNHWFGAADTYYEKEFPTTTSTGETALHRLVAQSVSANAIRTFLQHYKQHRENPEQYPGLEVPDRDYLIARNRAGATVLHVAVMRNSWDMHEVVSMLLDIEPQLASKPMKCGSYPLHILTGQALTNIAGYDSTLRTLLKAAPEVATRQDCNGDTPLSLLYKSVVRFQWARNWMDNKQSIEKSMDISSTGVISPSQYLKWSLTLLQTGCGSSGQSLSLHSVCATPRCPPLIVHMLVHQHEHYVFGINVDEQDKAGRLPLHVAAAAQPMSDKLLSNLVSHPTVIDVLVDCYPEASFAVDSLGRLPLHYAVDNPGLIAAGSTGGDDGRHPDHLILAFVDANPSALAAQDPVTGLYPAQNLSSSTARLLERSEQDENEARDQGGDANCIGMDVVYQLLIANPSVCSYHL